MLVTDLVNVRYLSGFTGSAGALLVYADDRPALLATDGRYRTQAARQARICRSPSNVPAPATWPNGPRPGRTGSASKPTW